MNRAVVIALLLFVNIADAHDLRPGILAFVEDEPGELRMRFVPPVDSRGEAIELALVLPDGCTFVREMGSVPIPAQPSRPEMGSVPIPAQPSRPEMGSVPIPAQPSRPEMGSVPIPAQPVPISAQPSFAEMGSVPISAQLSFAEMGSVPISAQSPPPEMGSVPISAQLSFAEMGSVPISAPPGAPPGTGNRVRCKRGFGGVLAVAGMRGHAMKIYVSHGRDGAQRDWVMTSDVPRIDLGPAPTTLDRLGLAAVGLLAGLLLVFGPSVRLVAAAFAFVATEAAAGLFACRGGFDEVAIASILFVAREATHDGLTAIRRWPWLVGALLGAVHGLAFAPRAGYLAAQLALVAVGAGLFAMGSRSVRERRIIGLRAHRAACYALGALAAWWLIGRLALA